MLLLVNGQARVSAGGEGRVSLGIVIPVLETYLLLSLELLQKVSLLQLLDPERSNRWALYRRYLGRQVML